jgi:hypothetical protein
MVVGVIVAVLVCVIDGAGSHVNVLVELNFMRIPKNLLRVALPARDGFFEIP